MKKYFSVSKLAEKLLKEQKIMSNKDKLRLTKIIIVALEEHGMLVEYEKEHDVIEKELGASVLEDIEPKETNVEICYKLQDFWEKELPNVEDRFKEEFDGIVSVSTSSFDLFFKNGKLKFMIIDFAENAMKLFIGKTKLDVYLVEQEDSEEEVIEMLDKVKDKAKKEIKEILLSVMFEEESSELKN